MNNLLSRDDNDPDDEGEDYIQEAYLPSGRRYVFLFPVTAFLCETA